VTVRTVSVALKAQVSDYMAKIGQARQATGRLVGELDKLGKESPEKFNRLALGMGVAGAALLGVAGMAVKTAMAFDKQMSAVGAVADATAADLGHLRDAALDAGKATVFSASEAAQAEEELAKAGIKVKDILGGGLVGALDLAAAGQMGLADAATIAAQTMNIFGLSGKAVPHIADVLAAASNKSAASMKDLGDALKQGGLLANQAGLSLEDTTGVLAAFADRALIGSDAGTSLKTMLQMLAGPSAKSASLMKELGIQVYDASGNFVGITKVAGILQEKLSGLTQAQRDAAMATIFGSDASRAANVLYGLGAQGLQGYIDAVNDSGAAADTAAKKTDNLAGDIERLKGSLETLAIESGSGANGGLRTLVKAVDALVSGFSELPDPIKSTATVLIGLSGAGLLAAAGMLKVRQTVKETLEVLENMGTVGPKAAAGLRSVASVGTKFGAIGLAIGGIWLGLDALSDWAARKHAPLKADIDKLTSSLKEFAGTGKAVGELAAKYGANLEKIGGATERVVKGQQDLAQVIADINSGLTDASTTNNWNPIDPQDVQLINDLDTALAGLVNNGGATQAALALEKMRVTGALTTEQYTHLIGMLPQYNDATRDAANANTGLAKGFADASTKASILSGSLSEAITKGQALTDVWNELHGALLGTDKALLDANKAIDAVKKSFDENGKAIKGNSTAALENRIAVGEAAKAAAEAASAKYVETQSVGEASAVYDTYIGKLRAALRAAGLTEAQVNDLIGAYATMPPAVTTKVTAPGLETALSRMYRLNGELDRADGRVSTSKVVTEFYSYRHDEVSSSRRWGGITTHAATGLLRDAAVYSPQGPARYAFAEPATKGEAFIPKVGDYGRSMSILSKAASWYGASVAPYGQRGMAPAGGGTQRIELSIAAASGANRDLIGLLVESLRYQVRTQGDGSAQKFFGRS